MAQALLHMIVWFANRAAAHLGWPEELGADADDHLALPLAFGDDANLSHPRGTLPADGDAGVRECQLSKLSADEMEVFMHVL